MKRKRVETVISYGLFGVVTFLIGLAYGQQDDSVAGHLAVSFLVVVGYITILKWGIKLLKREWWGSPDPNQSNSKED